MKKWLLGIMLIFVLALVFGAMGLYAAEPGQTCSITIHCYAFHFWDWIPTVEVYDVSCTATCPGASCTASAGEARCLCPGSPAVVVSCQGATGF